MNYLSMCKLVPLQKIEQLHDKLGHKPGYVSFATQDKTITDKSKRILKRLAEYNYSHCEAVDFVVEWLDVIQNSKFGVQIVHRKGCPCGRKRCK